MVLAGPERELRLNEIINERVSHLVMSDSLQPHGLQHIRFLCPPLSPGVCSNSYSLSQWCHPTISSSVIPFSSCPQSFPELGSFPVSWHFTSGGQNIGASASASVLPMNIPLQFNDLISFCPRDSQESSPTPQFKRITSLALTFLMVLLPHLYMTNRKTIALTRWTFVGKVKPLFFNMPSRLVIAFLPRSNCLLISWLQSPSTVILDPRK